MAGWITRSSYRRRTPEHWTSCRAGSRHLPSSENRSVTRGPVAEPSGGASAGKTIRAWARSEAIEVSDRGRVPAEHVKLYQDAHRR